jgi:hypothetical protein
MEPLNSSPGWVFSRRALPWNALVRREAFVMNGQDRDTSSLVDIRESWYQAFFSGDTQFMDGVEAQAFLVVNGHGIQTKQEQLAGIASACSAGRWFPRGTRKHDFSVAIQHHGNLCIVSGKGVTLIGGHHEKSPVFFSELWSDAAGSWQVLHLHYSPASEG